MKYLCLAYYDEQKFEALSKSDVDAIVSGCPPWDRALRATGKVLMQASLQSPRAAVSLRPCRGDVTISDGPFTETKEQVGAFFIVEAADRAEALRVAWQHPAAHLGEQVGWGVELREIENLVDS